MALSALVHNMNATEDLGHLAILLLDSVERGGFGSISDTIWYLNKICII